MLIPFIVIVDDMNLSQSPFRHRSLHYHNKARLFYKYDIFCFITYKTNITSLPVVKGESSTEFNSKNLV